MNDYTEDVVDHAKTDVAKAGALELKARELREKKYNNSYIW